MFGGSCGEGGQDTAEQHSWQPSGGRNELLGLGEAVEVERGSRWWKEAQSGRAQP
jgi:hypothetical protein